MSAVKNVIKDNYNMMLLKDYLREAFCGYLPAIMPGSDLWPTWLLYLRNATALLPATTSPR